MDRRELLKHISLLTGAAVVGADFFLIGCQSADNTTEKIGLFTKADIAFFDEVAEIIIPRTNTPGAKDAQVGQFMADFVTNCYDVKDQNVLKEGITKINEISQKQYNQSFIKITSEQKSDLLQKAALESKTYNEQKADDAPPHYFTLFQQLTLIGFFTSEPGFTQVLRYEIVPGKYEACIEYNGETAWAN